MPLLQGPASPELSEKGGDLVGWKTSADEASITVDDRKGRKAVIVLTPVEDLALPILLEIDWDHSRFSGEYETAVEAKEAAEWLVGFILPVIWA